MRRDTLGESTIGQDDPTGILLVTELYPPALGGTPTLFQNLYTRLSRIPVTVLTDRRLSQGPDVDVGRFSLRHANVAARQWGVLAPSGARHYLQLARQIRQLTRGTRSVVHCGRALPEGFAAWGARWVGAPIYVCWAHGEELLYANQSRELAQLARVVYQGAALVVANSRSTARMLAQFGVPDGRIDVVYPGVDIERFHPANDGRALRARLAEPNDVVLLSVGRLQRRKGHDLVLRALAQLAHTSPKLRYVVAGAGDELPRLEALAHELCVRDRVHFAAEVTDAELPSYYAASDIFVLPNRFEEGDIEGFGIVFLEAAAAGRPSIGGASGGVSEAVADGRTGLLVSGTDVGELSHAIERLAREPELRRRLGECGRERVGREFTWEIAAERMKTIHERLAPTRRARV